MFLKKSILILFLCIVQQCHSLHWNRDNQIIADLAHLPIYPQDREQKLNAAQLEKDITVLTLIGDDEQPVTMKKDLLKLPSNNSLFKDSTRIERDKEYYSLLYPDASIELTYHIPECFKKNLELFIDMWRVAHANPEVFEGYLQNKYDIPKLYTYQLVGFFNIAEKLSIKNMQEPVKRALVQRCKQTNTILLRDILKHNFDEQFRFINASSHKKIAHAIIKDEVKAWNAIHINKYVDKIRIQTIPEALHWLGKVRGIIKWNTKYQCGVESVRTKAYVGKKPDPYFN